MRLFPALTVEMLVNIAVGNGLATTIRDPDAALAAVTPSADHDDLLTAAGALMHGIVTHQPMTAGNEQLAWDASRTFLSMNGHRIGRADYAAAQELIAAVADGKLTDPAVIGRAIASS